MGGTGGVEEHSLSSYIPYQGGGPDLDNAGCSCHFFVVEQEKLERLREILRSYGSCLVAYSGGVDSVFLAYVAHQVLGERSLAVMADSPSLPRRERQEGVDLAHRFEIPLRVVYPNEFNNPDYLANPTNRCYFCKHELFVQLEPLAKEEGYAVVAYGENASDVGDHRPGAQAASEFQVRAPLKESELTKEDIRRLSAAVGLPTAEKPQMACLSSRIPYGEAVSPEKLQMIEGAENVLKDFGFRNIRVRHHELTLGQLARIELGRDEIPQLLSQDLFADVAERVKEIGYTHVTLDMMGYRRGSLNESSRRRFQAAGSQ